MFLPFKYKNIKMGSGPSAEIKQNPSLLACQNGQTSSKTPLLLIYLYARQAVKKKKKEQTPSYFSTQ